MAHSLSSVRTAAGIALAAATIGAGVAHIRSGDSGDCWERIAQQSPIEATPTAAPTPEPILSMTVDELFQRYETNPDGTEKALRGRLVGLTGEQQSSGPNATMLVARRNDSGLRGAVICQLSPPAMTSDGPEKVAPSADGERLTVYGRFKSLDENDNDRLIFRTHGMPTAVLDATDILQGAPAR